MSTIVARDDTPTGNGHAVGTAVSSADLLTLRSQLGRAVRDVLSIPARCVCGAPVVVTTRPRLADGSPFPTFYYLTHPAATAAVSRLEASGRMVEYQAMLVDTIAGDYQAAHEGYLRDRLEFGDPAEIRGISAGGMPERVKCLHALVAHSLAVGPGVNPIGDIALAECDWSPTKCECRNDVDFVADRAPGASDWVEP